MESAMLTFRNFTQRKIYCTQNKYCVEKIFYKTIQRIYDETTEEMAGEKVNSNLNIEYN